ncbi:MAG: sugar transferase (PEP-CTERM system associated) [Janthinobacterium sp.]|jgi:sugar transferase (PEP-CTERM system associated)
MDRVWDVHADNTTIFRSRHAIAEGESVIRMFRHYVSKAAVVLLFLEIMILLMAVLVPVLWLSDSAPSQGSSDVYLSSMAFALVIVFSMSTFGMYQSSATEDFKNTLLRIMPSFALGFGLLSVLIQWLPLVHFGASTRNLIFELGGAGIVMTRLAVFTSSHSNMLKSRLLLVGTGDTANDCMVLAAGKLGFHQFDVVGCVAVAGEDNRVPLSAQLPAGPSLLDMVHKYNAQEIVVAVSDRRNGAFPVQQLLDCALGGIKVIDGATFFEREACQIRIDSLLPSYLIFGGGFDQSFLRSSVKRVFDLAASAALCVATLPVMLAAALWIRIDDGGPVLYRQERVGKDGRVFMVLKFRSMRNDAELDGKPKWAAKDDPRVTRSGYWMRKLRIDELPQLLNVFKGDMSFVGPRPERAFFVDQLNAQIPYYSVRHSIKPGITGLAQVRYQYAASIDDTVRKMQYDLYYVKNNSLFLDLLILIETIQVVLLGKGSR